MNRIIKSLLFVILLSFCCINVNASEYSTKQLIEMDKVATVKTESLTYNNISYIYDQNSNKSLFHFDSVVNNTNKSLPLSIDILLFDSNKKNIGIVTYCSEKDLDSSYAQIKLKAGESNGLEIIVADKYFVKDRSSKDISYYAVLDENPYCHIGGYDKYKGLTIEEIVNGKVSAENNSIQELIDFMDSIDYRVLFFSIFILIIVYIVTGIFLNELNKKMNATSTPLAYVPIGNNYLAVKLAFGGFIATIFIICLFVSIVLSILGIGFVTYIISFVSSAAFIIDIIKLITKKYDLFMFEPTTSNYIKPDLDVNNRDFSSERTEPILPPEAVDTPNNTGDEIINLNYSDPEPEGTLPTDEGVNISVGNNDSEDSENKMDTNKEGETDLSNLFK